MVILYLVVGVAIYFALPFWLQLIISITNFFIPDPIPIIDEILMIVGMLKKLEFIESISDFLLLILGLLLLAGMIALIGHFVVPWVLSLFAV